MSFAPRGRRLLLLYTPRLVFFSVVAPPTNHSHRNSCRGDISLFYFLSIPFRFISEKSSEWFYPYMFHLCFTDFLAKRDGRKIDFHQPRALISFSLFVLLSGRTKENRYSGCVVFFNILSVYFRSFLRFGEVEMRK